MTSKTRMLALIKAFNGKEIAAALKEDPALIRFRDEKGRSWLHICAAVRVSGRPPSDLRESVRLAEMLIEHGLDPDGAAFVEDEWKATPLWYAIGRGRNLELARFLIKQGVNPNHALWSAVFSRNVPALRLLVQSGANVDLGDECSPLVYCARWGHFEVVSELLKLGADVNFQGPKKKLTALHYMVENSADIKHMRMLLDHGARCDLSNARGLTALEMMRRKRDARMRKLAEELVDERLNELRRA